jgi:hypothetical protein
MLLMDIELIEVMGGRGGESVAFLPHRFSLTEL